MKKIKNAFLFLTIAIAFLFGTVTAKETKTAEQVETSEPENANLFCELFGMSCSVGTLGNGGGKEPPVGTEEG